MDDDDVFENLPDDPELAFCHLEALYKRQLENDVSSTDESSAISHFRARYINQIIAAAKALDINGIKDYEAPKSQSEVWSYYEVFATDVMNLIIQIRIGHARRKRFYSVALSSAEKEKIRHYISQIKQLIDASDLSKDKKDAIYKRLTNLELEIDKDRTRFELIAETVLGFARLSRDVEQEGAEPWWKWAKLIFGVVDEAKEKEEAARLPSPEERKRLAPPRRKPPTAEAAKDLDDEIPF